MEKGKYLLKNIILINSILKRASNADRQSYENQTNIQTAYQQKENQLFVTLKIILKTTDVDEYNTPALYCEIEYLGHFEIENKDNLELSIEKFATLNGPAIILPYIRQHLTDLTVKAGFNPYYLPPVNFHKLNENK